MEIKRFAHKDEKGVR